MLVSGATALPPVVASLDEGLFIVAAVTTTAPAVVASLDEGLFTMAAVTTTAPAVVEISPALFPVPLVVLTALLGIEALLSVAELDTEPGGAALVLAETAREAVKDTSLAAGDVLSADGLLDAAAVERVTPDAATVVAPLTETAVMLAASATD